MRDWEKFGGKLSKQLQKKATSESGFDHLLYCFT
jgi:hypothetical protein